MASGSAVLLFAAFPPFHLLAPSFVALVPLAVMAGTARTPDRAVRGGFLFGVLHYGLLLHWMVPALLRVTTAAAVVYATAVLLLAFSTALTCWTVHRLRHRTGIPLWLALPLAWTGGEWLIAHLPGALAYPWLGLGTSLTGYPQLVGVAEVVGARGVTFWLALVNGLLAEGVARGAGWRRVELWTALAAAVAPAAWGVWRADHLDVRPGPVVTAARTTLRVQPGQEVADLAALGAVDSLLAGGGVRASTPSLVVLPEGTLREGLDRPEVAAGLGDLSRRVGAPVLVGVVRAPGGGAGRYNSAVVAGPAGPPDDLYDKRRLVPWVERMPLRWLLAPDDRDAFRPGDEWTVLRAGEHSIGVLICYEAAFADAARALRRAGAGVLVNMTNDAWFARVGVFAIAQHEAHLVMRAIETRTGVVRSANLGPTSFIDPAGRVRARTSGGAAAVLTAQVDAAGEPTWFVRLGDVAGPGAAAAVLLLILAPAFTRRAALKPIRSPPRSG